MLAGIVGVGMTKMFLRYVSAAVLLVIVSVSAAQAQKMFKVCRGEDIARCGGTDVNAFIGCSDVKSFAQNACPAETGVNSIFLRSTVPGNQCGYSHYDVTCNPEIAPRSVLTTAGAVLGLLFAIVSLVSVTWMLGARSKEASAVQADVPTMAKSDLGNLVLWISIVGGMVGLIVSALAFYYRFFQDTTIQKLGLLDWLIVPAFAQDNAAKPENWFK